MKFLKRLAAGLLAGIMAASAVVSAGALSLTEMQQGHFGKKKMETDTGYQTYGGKNFYYSLSDAENSLETLTNPGVIENPGNPETEKPILIPASKLENYPVGTIIRVKSDYDLSNGMYAEVADRSEFNYSPHRFSSIEGSFRDFVLTEKMKKNGFVLTGYMENGVEEIPIENKPATVSSVSFTAAVAKESVHTPSAAFNGLKKTISIDWAPGASASGLPLTESCQQAAGDTTAPATIPAEAFRDIPVGSVFVFTFNTTQKLPPVTEKNSVVPFIICVKDGSGNCDHALYYTSGYVFQYPSSVTDPSESGESEFGARYSLPVSLTVTENMKANGITFYLNYSDWMKEDEEYMHYIDSAFLEDFYFEVLKENSDLFSSSSTDDPAAVPGYTSNGDSIKNAAPNTTVTQKTAIADGLYSERFIQKVAAADIVGKTKATFTLSNGTVTETVTTTRYNTALTVDGETVSAGSGYVYLVYTLSGIPADVNITVLGVTLA